MRPARAADYAELTSARSKRIALDTQRAGRAVVVVHPLRHVTGEIEQPVLVSAEAANRCGQRIAIVVVIQNVAEECARTHIRDVGRVRRRRQVSRPRVFAEPVGAGLIASGRPRPFGLGRQSIARALWIASHYDRIAFEVGIEQIERRESFLFTQPITEKRRLLPADSHHRLGFVIQRHAVAGAGTMLRIEQAELAVSHFIKRQIKRFLEDDISQHLVGPAARLAARRTHAKRVGLEQRHALAGGILDDRLNGRDARLFE